MDEYRGMLQRLHQVGLDGIFSSTVMDPAHFRFLGGHGLAIVGNPYDDPAQALPQVEEIGGEARIAITSEATEISNPLSRG